MQLKEVDEFLTYGDVWNKLWTAQVNEIVHVPFTQGAIKLDSGNDHLKQYVVFELGGQTYMKSGSLASSWDDYIDENDSWYSGTVIGYGNWNEPLRECETYSEPVTKYREKNVNN